MMLIDDVEHAGSIIWNYYKIDGAHSKNGGAKNVTCTFSSCDNSFTACSSTRALLISLGELFSGKRAHVKACVPIRKDDDNRYAQFKNAQTVLDKDMLAKEKLLSSSKAKQTILDLTSPAKRTSTGELKVIESKTLDSAIANVFYENALPFTVADSPSLARLVEQCIEFGQQHPGRKYKAPNRRRIAGPLLESAYEDTAALVQPVMDRAIKYGGTWLQMGGRMFKEGL
jgi:hypothetical protein